MLRTAVSRRLFASLGVICVHAHYMYYVQDDAKMVFFLISSIPIVLLVIWVIVSRARAAAFESSRVQYAEYLEREKSLAKLAEANARRVNDP